MQEKIQSLKFWKSGVALGILCFRFLILTIVLNCLYIVTISRPLL